MRWRRRPAPGATHRVTLDVTLRNADPTETAEGAAENEAAMARFDAALHVLAAKVEAIESRGRDEGEVGDA